MASHISTYIEISQSKTIELDNVDIYNLKELFTCIHALEHMANTRSNGGPVEQRKLVRKINELACCASLLAEFCAVLDGKKNFEGDIVKIEKDTRKLLPTNFVKAVEAGDIAI